MSYFKDPNLPRNTARRHFLGVAAAAGARVASLAVLTMAASTLPVRAAGLHLGWGNGNGNPGGNGNGKGGGAQCFLRGTAILTDCGEKPVEDLRVGDNVALPDGSTRPVKCKREFRCAF